MAVASSSSPGKLICAETRRVLNKLTRADAAAGGTDGVGLSDSDLDELDKLIRRHQQNTDRLHRLSTGKSKAKFEDAWNLYLGAFATRLCATVRVFAKKQQDASLKDLLDFAKVLDVHERLTETVEVRFLPKAKGGFRPITRMGAKRMAQQFIVRDLLTVMGVDSEIDYARPGAGGEKAMIRDVCSSILDGYTSWQTADIKNYFASLGPGHLRWLPVPRHLLRNVLFIPRCASVRIVWSKAVREALSAEAAASSPSGAVPMLSVKEEARKLRREVRSVLPQGAVSSPLVARAFSGREIRAVLGIREVVRCSFIDDLTIGARTEQEVREALEAILSRLNSHPAGPLHLHIDKPTSAIKERVKTFGYNLELRNGYGNNPIHVSPGPERFDRFHRKALAKWRAEPYPNGPGTLEEFVDKLLDGWMPSQQAWTTLPACSRNLALTGAFIYVCEHEVSPPP